MGYTLIEESAGEPAGRYRIIEDAPNVRTDREKFSPDITANGYTLKVGPLDTGIEVPDWAYQGLAGAGKRLSDIGTLGMRDTSMDKPLMEKGWAQAGSAGSDIAAILAASSLMRGGGAMLAKAAPNVGNALALVGNALGAPKSALEAAAASGAYGAATTPGDASERATQGGIAAIGGAASQGIINALARIVRPNASFNPDIRLLKDEGVNMTIGQALGGRYNALEEKLQSLPFTGDMITNARKNALADFNNAAINRASGKVGETVSGSGHDAVKAAGDALSDAYNKGKSALGNFKVDTQAATDLQALESGVNAATNLSDAGKKTFFGLLDLAKQQISPNGHILAEGFKEIDSKLGKEAGRFSKSSDAYQQNLGDAISEIQRIIVDNAKRANPAAAEQIAKADAGWANLVRVEGAAKAAKNADGVFTPAQLNSAIQQADQSTRGRAVARGNALLQDLGNAGQNVLGNKYPDSGTAGRLAAGAMGAASYGINPLIPAALATGGAVYTRPVQNLLTKLLTERPEAAALIAQRMKQVAPLMAPVGASALSNVGGRKQDR